MFAWLSPHTEWQGERARTLIGAPCTSRDLGTNWRSKQEWWFSFLLNIVCFIPFSSHEMGEAEASSEFRLVWRMSLFVVVVFPNADR